MKGLLKPLTTILLSLSPAALLAQTSGAGEAAAPADAPCTARLDAVTSRGSASYLPFNPGDVYEQLQISVTESTGCRLGFTFRSLNASRLLGDGDALNYEVRSSGGRRARLDGETVEPASGWIGATANRFDAFATIASGQAVRPGTYQDRLVIQLVDAGRVLDEREIGVTTRVLAQARVSVGGAGASGFSALNGGGLDFGSLQSGAQRSAQLFVRANASVAVQLRSDHGSKLRRIGSEQTGVEIPYTVSVGGVAGDLARPMSMNLGAPVAGGDAEAVDLTVRLGAIDGQLAGDYRDTITVDVLVLE